MTPKGKQPTKGSRQILEENTATVNFYRNMALATCVIYGLSTFFLYYDDLTTFYICLNIFVISIYFGCYRMMVHMTRPTYAESKQLIDPGLDLNAEGAMGEHIKDIIIMTSITHVLALVSNYFWLLLFLLPLRALWLLWTNILAPWFFQEAPENIDQDDKKRKKIERKKKRMVQ